MQAMHGRRLVERNALHQVCNACVDVCCFAEEAAIASQTLTIKQLTLRTASQSVATEQVACPGSKTSHQYLQGAECCFLVESSQ